MLSVLLATISAVLTQLGARHADHRTRRLLFCLALGVMASAFIFGDALGGFWAGFYTLIAVYTLVCVFTPWIAYLARKRRAH